ncbi:MAG: transposase [Blautia sp.]|nr:transposase [Lachnoclostridium sp.]MCM1210303.1 transposase [Blautia sp.]
MTRKKIGEFSAEIIETLGLDIPIGTPIYIANSNIEHMKSSHPKDFAKYGNDIEYIIATPDYVGKNPKDDSIEFTKEYILDGEFVKVAVRVSLQNIYYARSMYVLNPHRVKNFISNGTLIKLDSLPQ